MRAVPGDRRLDDRRYLKDGSPDGFGLHKSFPWIGLALDCKGIPAGDKTMPLERFLYTRADITGVVSNGISIKDLCFGIADRALN